MAEFALLEAAVTSMLMKIQGAVLWPRGWV